MQAVLHQLFLSTSVLIVCALALGLVFERFSPGTRRDALVGIVCGAFAMLAMSMSIGVGGHYVDGRAPLLIAAGLFGGPIGALAAIPFPIAMRLELGGPGVPAGLALILGACGLGAGTRALLEGRSREISRRSILALAAVSPVLILATLAPFTGNAERALDQIALPLLMFLPFGTAVIGIVALNELQRADRFAEERNVERFLRITDLISKEHFLAKIDHQSSLHERYGVHYAVLIVSIDNALAMRASARTAAWDDLHADVARTVRGTLRDSDVCAALDFDRIGVLLPYTGPISAYGVAERIAAAVSESVSFAGHALTVSIGIGHVGHASATANVLQDAEAELFRALSRTSSGAIGPRPQPLDVAPSGLRCFPGALPINGAAANDTGAAEETAVTARQSEPAPTLRVHPSR